MTHSTNAADRPASVGPIRIDWEGLLVRHDRWLRTTVWARLGDWQAVEEVMQEVAAAAIAQQAPLADAGKAAPWLHRLAVRQALLHRRRRGRRRGLAERYAQRFRPTEEQCRTPDPLTWLLVDEQRRLVREALARLARRDREVLLLKYTEDWSYRELAEHLGVSHSAVEARLHRARARLRRELTAINGVEVGT